MIYLKLKKLLDNINHYRQQKLSNKHFLVVVALIVGVFGGLGAALLKLSTHHIAAFLQNDLQWRYKVYIYLFFPFAGILLSVAYVKYFIRKSSFDTGLTQILYAISRRSSRIPFHNIYSQLITSAVTIGFGGSAGLEAPVVVSGSAIGSWFGRLFNLNYRETTMLLACGAAAGIAGAFNSPVAGIVFAVEVLLPEFSIPAFIPLLISAATAAVVSRLLFSGQLFYMATEDWKVGAIIFYVIMAVIIGLFSIYFAKVNYRVKHYFKKIHSPIRKAAIGGAVLGLLIFVFPVLYGEGYIGIQQLLAGHYESLLINSIFSEYSQIPLALVAFAFLTVFAKSVATLITFAAGGNGGIFGPSLIMGGLLGFVFAYSVNQTGIVHLNVSNFIVAGMAAAMSGIMHAPLTGIFLIAEITGGYVLMVPLMLVSAISYLINKNALKHSIYTKDLAAKGELLTHEDKDNLVLSMMRLKYVIDKDFIPLQENKLLEDCKIQIINSKRNIFPVVNKEGMLTGIIYSQKVFNHIVNKAGDQFRIGDLKESPLDVVNSTDSMQKVMQKMNREDIWMLPVVNNGRYVGFVSKTTVFNKYRALLLRQAQYL